MRTGEDGDDRRQRQTTGEDTGAGTSRGMRVRLRVAPEPSEQAIREATLAPRLVSLLAKDAVSVTLAYQLSWLYKTQLGGWHQYRARTFCLQTSTRARPNAPARVELGAAELQLLLFGLRRGAKHTKVRARLSDSVRRLYRNAQSCM
eukprot:3680166-Pleurochrysis_carterae.AAC.1